MVMTRREILFKAALVLPALAGPAVRAQDVQRTGFILNASGTRQVLASVSCTCPVRVSWMDLETGRKASRTYEHPFSHAITRNQAVMLELPGPWTLGRESLIFTLEAPGPAQTAVGCEFWVGCRALETFGPVAGLHIPALAVPTLSVRNESATVTTLLDRANPVEAIPEPSSPDVDPEDLYELGVGISAI
jgi:hypothetical protein